MPNKISQNSLLTFEEVEPEPEWIRWYQLSPTERLIESFSLWSHYFSLGGSLAEQPDTQSPFFDIQTQYQVPNDGGTGLRIVRRSGV